MPSREFAMFVQESSYGVPIATPVKGTSLFYPRLHESDSYTGQMNPVLLDIPYGGGWVTPALQVSDQYGVAFNFSTYLYAGAYCNTLLNWAMTTIDSGRTLPWVTTDPNLVMPPGDLASMSIYHAIQMPDGSYDRRRYGGAKVNTWSITCSRAEPRAMLSITGSAIRDDLNAAGAIAYPLAAEFPNPGELDYPTNPYLFSQTAGYWQLIDTGATLRTQYSSIGISCTNANDPRWFESQYQILSKFCGRTTTLNSQVYLKPTPDDLHFFQTKTPLLSNLEFNNGTNTVKIDLHTHNYLKGVARNLVINNVYQRTLTVQNFWDPTITPQAGDLVLTTT